MSQAISSDDAREILLTSESYHTVLLEDIYPNLWNPNVMAPENYEALKLAIQKDKGNKNLPLLVRPHPTEPRKYELIDGFHRWKVLNGLGKEKALVVIENLSDKDARMQTILMNHLRGEFDEIRLSKLLKELKEKYGATDEELQERLGYSEDELQEYESLLHFKPDESTGTIEEDEDGDTFTDGDIEFFCSPEDFAVVKELIALTKASDFAAAFCSGAEKFLKLRESQEIFDSVFNSLANHTDDGGTSA